MTTGGWDGVGNVYNCDGVHAASNTQCDQQTTIDKALFDTMFTTITDAIENCVARDGQNSPSANLPMNSKKLTGLTTGSALTDSVSATQVVNSTLLWGGTSTGSANTHAISVTIAPSAYVAGQRFAFLAGYSNTAACTLNVNSLGAKSIKLINGSNPGAGAISLNAIIEVVYDGTNFQLTNALVIVGAITCSSVTASGDVGCGSLTTTTINKGTSGLEITGLGGVTHHGIEFFIDRGGTVEELISLNTASAGNGILTFDSTNYPVSGSAGADTGTYLRISAGGGIKKLKLYADS